MKIKKMPRFLFFFTHKRAGISLAPFGIYIKKRYLSDMNRINHEKIHWKQQWEMLLIFFYLWYVVEWFLKVVIKRKTYRTISFEREAYKNSSNFAYLSERKLYRWTKYL